MLVSRGCGVGETEAIPRLRVVDGLDFDEALRSILRPGELVRDPTGLRRRLPRFFYEVADEEVAGHFRLTSHFAIGEFLRVDLKEAERMRDYPRYVPCAVRYLAFYLEQFRQAVGAPVHISVNGGYRSPSHQRSENVTPHLWATAADVFRIGSTLINDRDSIEKYGRVAGELSDDFWVMPYGHEIGTADDHLHLDLGYVNVVPRGMGEDPQDAATAPLVFEERRHGERRGEERRAGEGEGE